VIVKDEEGYFCCGGDAVHQAGEFDFVRQNHRRSKAIMSLSDLDLITSSRRNRRHEVPGAMIRS
jgi:hypothetical protein